MSELLSEAKDGLSQQERKIAALFPENFRIDEKDGVDLLRYLYELAGEFNFYNTKNEIEGDWRDFFQTNANLLILITSRQDYAENLTRLEHIEAQLQLTEHDETFFRHINSLFDFLAEAVANIQQLQHQFTRIYAANIRVQSIAKIAATLNDQFGHFKNIYLQYKEVFSGKVHRQEKLEKLHADDKSTPQFFNTADETLREQAMASVKFVKGAFNDLRRHYNQFLGAINYYLRGYDLFKDKQPPHLALCLAFIHLYQYLQEQLNLLPKKHLDFYYRDILNFKPLPEQPDSTYVLFEADPTVEMVNLKKGEELLAEIGSQKPLIYITEQPLQLTGASVAQLKTLYISKYTWNADLAEINMLRPFQADFQPLTATELLKPRGTVLPKAVLGENQGDFGMNERTMDDTAIGTIISSPVLYLPEGDRRIKITIYLSKKSAVQLDGFINSYQQIKDADFLQTSFDLFNEAFNVCYTAKDGWLSAQRYNAVYAGNATDRYIEINISLPSQEEAPVVYVPGVHGDINHITFPAIRVNLNNGAAVHGYSFLRNLVIERIKINARVYGVKNFSLASNYGPVSSVAAFPPFGSPPVKGAPLLIKNTNVFNRYTKKVRLFLQWIGLPEVTGGFEEHYRAYGLNYKTDSFKIKVASVNNGRVTPPEDKQQEFELFAVDYNSEGHEYLLPETRLDKIDVQQLEFTNNPLMDAENNVAGTGYDNGALQIELSNPPSAFGHEAYPQLVADVMVHNSRRFVRKRPMPNPPYTPMVKTLRVDYILEASEALRRSVRSDGNNITVHHLCPFGYMQAYPGHVEGGTTLFPDLQQNRNLFIGLKNVVPGQELSLLFYLEEKNFIESLGDEAAIRWSYLDRNEWVSIPASGLIADTTNNLVNTGIVRITVPRELCIENTVMPSGLFWLRLSVDGFAEVYTKLIAVTTNAVLVTRQGLAPEHFELLKPGKIKSFNRQIAGIKQVIQPFYAFNGRAAESEADFYVRVSERLRHKNRPVTVRQIEQFILQAFPELLMAKCITRNETVIEQTEGPGATIKVILIPRLNDNGAEIVREPMVNLATLYKVNKLLRGALPAFIYARVANPVYERVKVVADIVFANTESANQQFYLNQLFQDIRDYFCPWINKNVFEIKIGSKVFVSEVLSFIKELPYVNSVTRFSMVHFFRSRENSGEYRYHINDLAISGDTFLQGSVPEAILIPADEHLISVSISEEYHTAVAVGIGDLAVDAEFLVTENRAEKGLQQHNKNEDSGEDEYFNLTIHEI
ncbi:hypothetical protein MUY27_01325 [Mucilaginibacter sp. RS28]|uniref:Baseplate J-like protein n=1 Tax=Mucilaginibacter straminoryzae TaxID=2932774 RepID=A0A9X1WZD7_9SPHI|nr:hypothetical protein [Mucilaginibacter straminoryzae]MCJ8208329.1 hypothetical protein [Mucilaginibacter straminoryzae]